MLEHEQHLSSFLSLQTHAHNSHVPAAATPVTNMQLSALLFVWSAYSIYRQKATADIIMRFCDKLLLTIRKVR